MNYAKLDLSDSAPKSLEFDDIYFSLADGVAESVFHFLVGNNLESRFAELHSHASTEFVIAETGFGTGLNFLVTVDLWQQCLMNEHSLHFISTEKYPINRAELENIYQQADWFERFPISQALIESYPCNISSGDVLKFQFDNIQLTVFIGDTTQSFSQTHFDCDAWFLDGFAPSKNPQMWTDELYLLMAQHSNIGATFATFTAASHVRKGLASHGFSIVKTKGFGKKRERLTGCLSSKP